MKNNGRKGVALVASGVLLGAAVAGPAASAALTAQQSSQRIYVDAFDFYHNGAYQYTRYLVLSL